ncbi:MAG: hypothetical protein Q8S22_06625 [Eubacteriales bacterium]|jgi:hypothetical protein|nr:hypothetical protein [Eubacteriales bacterium]
MDQPIRTPYSKDGYIVDQARLTHIRYGVLTSDINGCGWIAAYNFLKRMGENVDEKTLADELIRHTVFRGLVGTDLFRLRRKLKKHGYRMPIKFRWNKKARLPEGTSAGIIYYCHKDGFHFVTFYADESLPPEEDGEARFRFLNGLAGKENHISTMRGFLTKNNVIPFALILAWPGKKEPAVTESREEAQ